MKKTKYKSPLEESVAGQLPKDWEYESITLEYIIPYSKHRYKPDHVNRKKRILIEDKGGGPIYGLTPDTKQKMLLVKEQWPEWDIRFCFENAKLKTGIGRGKKKVTYGEWADINGFKWCERVIPKEWLT